MNRLRFLFFGIVVTFGSSWLGLVVYPYFALGRLSPEVSEAAGGPLPPPMSGEAIAGQRVYAANGCVSCHSQQVRSSEISNDIARGFGTRRTVARDYIYENPVFIGTQRVGPDLTNIGARQQDPQWFHRHLYEPGTVTPGSIMPSYRFLYKKQKIQGQLSAEALVLTGPHKPEPGWEVVPSEDARNLVAYLLSLKRDYPLAEAPPEATNSQ